MATATASATQSSSTAQDFTLPVIGGHSHFLIRRLHSLTGIIFGGYLVVHLLVNATLIEGRRDSGPTVFQLQVDKIHGLPFLVGVEWALIYLPILFHTFYGLWITFTGQPNALSYPYGKNWFYFFQRASAIVIGLFIAFHVFAMKGAFGGDVGRALTFAPVGYATQSTVNHMHAAWWVGYVVYPIGILASCYHLANGFWTAAITWGLTISAAAQRRWGFACGGLFALTFGCGMIALVAALREIPAPIPQVNDRGGAVTQLAIPQAHSRRGVRRDPDPCLAASAPRCMAIAGACNHAHPIGGPHVS